MLTLERRARVWAPILVLACWACSAASRSDSEARSAAEQGQSGADHEPASAAGGPYVLLLGTAQDGGLPQIACEASCCRAAREDPARRRWVASALVVDPSSSRRWLLDATPDLGRQLELAACRSSRPRRVLVDSDGCVAELEVVLDGALCLPSPGGPPPPATSSPAPCPRSPREPSAADYSDRLLAQGHGAPQRAGGRPALFDAVFLTHAHAGHYTGLLQLGREAYGSAPQRVLGSARMVAFLSANEPWALLARLNHVRYEALELEEPFELASALSIEAFAVPHRGELSDTCGFLVRGPRRALLYLPDIDAWEPWERRIEDLLATVDVALIDGTFFDAGELPGRDASQVPHPLVADSLERFARLPASERAKIRFFHLNHTNPAADPASEAAARVRAAGMSVAREGERFEL